MIPADWIRDLHRLKLMPRAGWFRAGIDHPESVADHSFVAALLAWRLARELPGLNATKVLLMMLLHDVHEARLTDIPDPSKFSSSSRARSKTGSGSTAGPALKLYTRPYIVVSSS